MCRRRLLAAFVTAFPLFFAIRRVALPVSNGRDAATSQPVSHTARHQQQWESEHPVGAKLPAPAAEALVHYPTSAVTPQLTAAEIGLVARALARRAPCNMLVSSGSATTAPCGWCSTMAAAPSSSRTTLPGSRPWMRSPTLGSSPTSFAYDTKVADADALLALRDDPGQLHRPAGPRFRRGGLPAVFYELEWHVILVDAPKGYEPWMPGRMGPIYAADRDETIENEAAGMVGRARQPGDGATDVFVHNVDRPVEDRFTKAFLCEAYAERFFR
ncbi:hypothetical protein ACP70R_010036 [Stipagrostis hirtigluma subsp. patula]